MNQSVNELKRSATPLSGFALSNRLHMERNARPPLGSDPSSRKNKFSVHESPKKMNYRLTAAPKISQNRVKPDCFKIVHKASLDHLFVDS